MNVQVTVRVTFAVSSPLSPSTSLWSLSSGPLPVNLWLHAGNEGSRHAWSGLWPGKAGRQAKRGQAGRDSFSPHSAPWAWEGHQKGQPEVFEEGWRVMLRELEDRRDKQISHLLQRVYVYIKWTHLNCLEKYLYKFRARVLTLHFIVFCVVWFKTATGWIVSCYLFFISMWSRSSGKVKILKTS